MTRTIKLVFCGLLATVCFQFTVAIDLDVPLLAQNSRLAVGDTVPDFSGNDEACQDWRLADRVGKKVLVLYFQPGDFTGGCTRQAQAYRDGLIRIEAFGAEVVGVSGDEVTTHKLFKSTYGLAHSLLADPKGEIANLFEVPIRAGGKVRATGPDRKPLFDENGKRIELEREMTFARCTVIIDRNGRIASFRRVIDPVMDVDEVLRIVTGLAK